MIFIGVRTTSVLPDRATLLLWSIEDSSISDGVREKSGSSREDILRIYFD